MGQLAILFFLSCTVVVQQVFGSTARCTPVDCTLHSRNNTTVCVLRHDCFCVQDGVQVVGAHSYLPYKARSV